MPALNTHSMSDLKGLNLASTSGNAGIGCQSGFHSCSRESKSAPSGEPSAVIARMSQSPYSIPW